MQGFKFYLFGTFIIITFYFTPAQTMQHEMQELQKHAQEEIAVQNNPLQAAKVAFRSFQTRSNSASQKIKQLLTRQKLIDAGSATALTAIFYSAYNLKDSLFAHLNPEFQVMMLLLYGATGTATACFPYFSRKSAFEQFYDALLTDNLPKVEKIYATGSININRKRLDFQTITPPLLMATAFGYADMVHFLLQQGADINIQDEKGKAIADYVQFQAATEDNPGDPVEVRRGKIKIMKMLLQRNLAQSSQKQRHLIQTSEQAEAVATEALEALHAVRYNSSGIKDILPIITGYFTPHYLSTREKGELSEIKLKRE